MIISMQKGYSYNKNPKYNVIVDILTGTTSNGIVIPACSRVDIETDTNVTAEITTFFVPKNTNFSTFSFTGATWTPWDGTSYISPNITGIRGINAGGSTETLQVECS